MASPQSSIIFLLCLFVSQVIGQDEGENPNLRLNENPYIFLYYDI